MGPDLVILAAGAGSRYGGLKQLAPVGPGGEALLEYSIYDAVRVGFSRAVLVIRQESESAFRDRLDARIGGRVPLVYAHQSLDDLPAGFGRPPGRVKPWGTAHAILAAEAVIGGAFAAVNADDFYGAESFARMFEFLGESRTGPVPVQAMIGFEVAATLSDSGPVSRALCRLDDQGLLKEIVELENVRASAGRIVYGDAEGGERTLRPDELVSMNMWGFTPEVFPELRRRFGGFLARSGESRDAEFLLPDVVQSLLREKRVRVEVLRGGGRWCGITFRGDEARARATLVRLVARGRYPERLWG